MTASTIAGVRKFNQRLGRGLSALRQRRGLSSAHAADLLGWTDARLSKIEKGRRSATMLEVQALLELYGGTVAELELDDPPRGRG